MLYFWPYIMFFSWPMTIPYILNTFIPSSYLPTFLRQPSTKINPPPPLLTIAVLGAMFLAVYFNTIIHPFTLADNRHYTFYVFRILRQPWIKFAAVPIYFICAWLSIITLAGSPQRAKSTSTTPVTAADRSKSQRQTQPLIKSDQGTNGNVTLSFLLIFLASTTLSLITAPLVEPRYFIIPWIIWRIHINPTGGQEIRWEHAEQDNKRSWLPHIQYSLYVETIWYLLINVVTGYMFLYKGFSWKQEPGVVQRFMW